jgi:transposase
VDRDTEKAGYESRTDDREDAPYILAPWKIGQAILFTRSQWENLRTYARDGDLSIDNNISERGPRSQAIGRRNCMLYGSKRGGRTAASLYSLVDSCERHQMDPFACLKDLLERLPPQPTDQLGELLNDAWITMKPLARRRVA